jgi:hypothetical protein
MRKLILVGKLREKGGIASSIAGVCRWQHVQFSLFGARANQIDSDLNCGLYNTDFKHFWSTYILKELYIA